MESRSGTHPDRLSNAASSVTDLEVTALTDAPSTHNPTFQAPNDQADLSGLDTLDKYTCCLV